MAAEAPRLSDETLEQWATSAEEANCLPGGWPEITLALIAEVRRMRAATALVRTPRGLMLQRSFMFGSGNDGFADVLCRNCGWKVHRRARDHQKVFDLAEAHDCSGVETAEERDAREATDADR